MLSIFTTCREFKGQFGIIQRNALRSWSLLRPAPEVFIMGDDYGSAGICRELNYIHIPDTPINERKVPILSSMFEIAERRAKNDVLLFVCSDMLLFQDTMKVIPKLLKEKKEFCASLHRHDVEIRREIDFEDRDWERRIKQNMVWGGFCAGDYYMFTKGFWNGEMPAFAIGRGFCDNWMFHYASNKDALIDVTSQVISAHQNHDHSHFSSSEGLEVWCETNVDFKKNLEYAGNKRLIVGHANWELTKSGGLRRRTHRDPLWGGDFRNMFSNQGELNLNEIRNQRTNSGPVQIRETGLPLTVDDSMPIPGLAVNDAFVDLVPAKHQSFERVATAILTILRDRRMQDPRFLELGCGGGSLAQYLHDNGVTKYVGIDANPLILTHSPFVISHPHKFLFANLQEEIDLDIDFDVVLAFDVLEHVPVDNVRALIKTITNHMHYKSVFIGTSSRAVQSSHLITKHRSWWSQLFIEHGLRDTGARNYYDVIRNNPPFYWNENIDLYVLEKVE